MKPGQIAIVIKNDNLQFDNVGAEVIIDSGQCSCLPGLGQRIIACQPMRAIISPYFPVDTDYDCGERLCAYRSSLIVKEDPMDETPTEVIKELTDGIR